MSILFGRMREDNIRQLKFCFPKPEKCPEGYLNMNSQSFIFATKTYFSPSCVHDDFMCHLQPKNSIIDLEPINRLNLPNTKAANHQILPKEFWFSLSDLINPPP